MKNIQITFNIDYISILSKPDNHIEINILCFKCKQEAVTVIIQVLYRNEVNQVLILSKIFL